MIATESVPQRRLEFRNAAPNVGEIWIFDCIGFDPLTGGGITADNFRKELAALGDVRDIHLFINSPGGSVFEAWGIIAQLQRHPARKMVFVDGIAASAGSAIAAIGDVVSIARHGMIMIHNAYVDAPDMADSDRQALKRINAQLVDLYAKKTKIARASIEKMMAGETWFDSREAVQLGFADKIHEPTRAVASWRGELPRFGARHIPKELPGVAAAQEYKVRYCLLADAPGRRFDDWKSHALDVVWGRVKQAMRQDYAKWRTAVHESGHAVHAMLCGHGERAGVRWATVHNAPEGRTLGYIEPKNTVTDDLASAALSAAGHEAEVLFGFTPGEMQDKGDGCDYRLMRNRGLLPRECNEAHMMAYDSLKSMRTAIAHVAYLLFVNRGSKVRESTIEMHLREIDFTDHPDWIPLLD